MPLPGREHWDLMSANKAAQMAHAIEFVFLSDLPGGKPDVIL